MVISDLFYDLSNITELKDLIYKDNITTDLNILNKHSSYSSINKQSYQVIRYNKDVLNQSLIPTYGLCRSIILNKNNRIVSFSPPKSIPSEDFITNYKATDQNIIAEEFIEGTMINVFWDPDEHNWEISTRNTVGAETKFYQDGYGKTFRTMFLEALEVSNLKLDDLTKELCYSFVLQHPENRIVVPFYKPQLYLVAAYCFIQGKTSDLLIVHPCIMSKLKDSIVFKNTSINFPEIYSLTSYSSLIEKYASMNTPYNIMGLVLHNLKTGERCKIRNPVYEQVRQLKGNQPKLQYQYLVLRQENRVQEYLTYYPEVKQLFSQFRDQLHLFTKTLSSNYISCYIKKEKPLLEYPEQYRTHMFHLHQLYMNEYSKKVLINLSVVINYVNNLHPSQQMFSLNYSLRKRYIDFKTKEPIVNIINNENNDSC